MVKCRASEAVQGAGMWRRFRTSILSARAPFEIGGASVWTGEETRDVGSGKADGESERGEVVREGAAVSRMGKSDAVR